MRKPVLLALVFPVLVLILPVAAFSDASVVQDSCVAVKIGDPPWPVWTYFTVINFSLPEGVCDLHFIPEPQPPQSGCVMNDTRNAVGWTSMLDPNGGASWWANTLNDCIQPGTSKGGFAFLLNPSYCCYIVQFTGPAGEVLLEQEECFTCYRVPTEPKTWGHIKQIYR